MSRGKENGSGAIVKLIDLGAKMVGSTASAVIAFIARDYPMGPTIGAVYAPAIAHLFHEVGNEIYDRHLSKRERGRTGAVMFFALKRCQENIESGQELRQDDFFDEQLGKRSTGEEIIEGTLIAAQRDHEEKKLRYYGNLLANIAFHPEIDKPQANLLLRLGQSISYRQMCLLSIFAHKDHFTLKKGRLAELSEHKLSVLQEIYDLYLKGMLFTKYNPQVTRGMFDLRPIGMDIIGLGATLYNLMELWNIDIQELRPIVALLNECIESIN